MSPPRNGPMTRPRLAKDCETPSVVPCSPAFAYFDIKLVREGITSELPIARSVAEIINSGSMWLLAMRASAMKNEDRPTISSDLSPKLFASLPIAPPCIKIPMNPTYAKK